MSEGSGGTSRPGVPGPQPAGAPLGELRELIGDCRRCALGDTRTCLVFGVGDPDAELMFVGEAPGRNEDIRGEPFVGAAGKLLDELLASIGLTRDQVYIANVLKCRPPGNRDPLPEEIETCTPFLREQIRAIAPKVIATLGNFATKFLLGTEQGITRVRGRLFRVDGRNVVPIYHPAAALYSPDKRDVLLEDFRRLRTVLDRPEGPAGVEDGEAQEADTADARPGGGDAGGGGYEAPTLF